MEIINISLPPFMSSWVNEVWESNITGPHLQLLQIRGIPYIQHTFPIRFDPEEFLI